MIIFTKIVILLCIGYIVGAAIQAVRNHFKPTRHERYVAGRLEDLTNDGMIDTMHHQWSRYQAVNPLQINQHALWQKWIRR